MKWITKLFAAAKAKQAPKAKDARSTRQARSPAPARRHSTLSATDINKSRRRYRLRPNTTKETLLKIIDSLPKTYNVVECIKGASVLTLGLDKGRLRFQLWEKHTRNPSHYRWTSPVSDRNRIFGVFSHFREGGDVEELLKLREDSTRDCFDVAKKRSPKQARSANPRGRRRQTGKSSTTDAYQQYAQFIDEERQRGESRLAEEQVRWRALLREERARWEQKLRDAEARSTESTAPPRKDHAYYASVLGISQTSDDREIKAIYRQRVKEYHPDRVACLGPKLRKVAEDEMKLINEAYEFLTRHA
jgi:hypothetical protein